MEFPVFETAMFFFDALDDFPGIRCGHTFTAVGHRLVLFGGCTNVVGGGGFGGMTNVTHCYDAMFRKWRRVFPDGEYPSPRAGHGAAAFGTKLFVQGGITASGLCSGELYSLNISSDTQFEWRREVVQGEGPGPRFGHVMASVGDMLVVFGGKNGDEVLSDTWALDLTRRPYVWQRLNPYGSLPSARMYASGCGRPDGLFVLCGGRDHTAEPLGDAYGLLLHYGESLWIRLHDMPSPPRYQHATVLEGQRMHVIGGVLKRGPLLEAEAAAAVLDTATGKWLDNNAQNYNQDIRCCRHAAAMFGNTMYIHGGLKEESVVLGDFLLANIRTSERSERLANVSVNLPTVEDAFYSGGTERFGNASLPKAVISALLRPEDWKPPVNRDFFLSYHQVAELCSAARNIIAEEPTVLELSLPIKVFGDIHGQFRDLMDIFKAYGSPSVNGDIMYTDYLFLGDYVDRGAHSLETIMLLLALKIEYPLKIHLIRGNHESRQLSALFGFQKECIERMGLWDGLKVWLDINYLFDYLPLAALIEKRVFCMHGGLGKSVYCVEQIASIPRPITLETDQSMVIKDLIWSDPTQDDDVFGIHTNIRGAHLCCFGPDIVWEFCKRNKIDLILRAHECVMHGFRRFAGGQLITVFSATNYCGTARNAGAILEIGRGFEVVAKIVHPRLPLSELGEIELSTIPLRPNSLK